MLAMGETRSTNTPYVYFLGLVEKIFYIPYALHDALPIVSKH